MGVISAVLADQIISASAEFQVSDWVLGAGRYSLDIQHNLESEKVATSIWENNVNEVQVDRIEILNTNNLRLFVTNDPDCRFAGRIIIFKTQE